MAYEMCYCDCNKSKFGYDLTENEIEYYNKEYLN